MRHVAYAPTAFGTSDEDTWLSRRVRNAGEGILGATASVQGRAALGPDAVRPEMLTSHYYGKDSLLLDSMCGVTLEHMH